MIPRQVVELSGKYVFICLLRCMGGEDVSMPYARVNFVGGIVSSRHERACVFLRRASIVYESFRAWLHINSQ